MQYSLFPELDDLPMLRADAKARLRAHFLTQTYGSYDSPYGDICLDREGQLDLYRGAVGAIRAGDSKTWSHPVRLMNGNLVDLGAQMVLLIYDFTLEHTNAIKRRQHEAEQRVDGSHTGLDINNVVRAYGAS